MGSWRWRVGVAAIALVPALALPASRATGQTPALKISMFGDSVMLGARDQLLAQLAGWTVTVDAVEDRSLLGAVSLLRDAGSTLGDVVVLDLGYNDVADPAVFRGRIDDAMNALAGVRRVVWLNQHDWGPGRAAMNAELAAATSRYRNLDVVDWNAEVAAHPEDVYGDSIHLTPAGQAAMATMVRAHVDQYVTSLTPTTSASTASPTTTPVSTATPARHAAARRASTNDDDTRDVAEVVGITALLLLGCAAIVVARRRAGQRRASISARRASGSVTGSRQANRSHT